MKKKVSSEYLVDDPLWYKDAIIYELHVRAFHDSNADGVGDFRGLSTKLDYLQELGVSAIWLLPFYPSPLRDDGYDISDYQNIHPLYGTLKDFDGFLEQAHRRGIRVITELVINHTSELHRWFQRARRAKKRSVERNYYMWSDSADKYPDARIIFKDFEQSNWTYDPVAGSYFWHRFYSHQPDLNFDSPAVRRSVMKILDFWLDRGVDGLRLDAVPYLYAREGTNCENLIETHGFLRELRKHVDANHKSRMLLAEANQWPEDAASYFGDGDECHMNFHFPLMPRLFMSLMMEDRFPIIDILEQTPVIPDNAQWALFLRNHDELTLEMVTDEERDYMYRTYARDVRARVNLGIRRRLAPLLGNNRRRIELMNALLFSLPGTPVIYYGDEIGMGDNVYLGDRNGVRTPMQWSADRNAGFSRANPQSLYLPVIIDPEYHFETINVEAQMDNPSSLFWWMKRLIGLRKRFDAFGRGTIEFLRPDNRKILAFTRQHGDQVLLIIANLSRFVQTVHLDLSAFAGKAPVEMFGQVEFPTVSSEPYFLSLGPHSFFWFSLEVPSAGSIAADTPVKRPTLRVRADWTALLSENKLPELERILPEYLRHRRWFRSKARSIDRAEVVELFNLGGRKTPATVLSLVEVSYKLGEHEIYLLPLGFMHGEEADRLVEEAPQAVIAQLAVKKGGSELDGILYDAVYTPSFVSQLLDLIERKRTTASAFDPANNEAYGWRTRAFRRLRGGKDADLTVHIGQAEQSNSSVIFGERFILKLYRRVEEGKNPEVEIGRYLTEAARFEGTPPVAGAVDYRRGKRGPMALALLQGYVPNQGDAWQFTLDEVERFLERAASMRTATRTPPAVTGGLVGRARTELPDVAFETAGPYFTYARILGERTADMHAALGANHDDPDFAPEAFSPFYRRALYQSLRNQSNESYSALEAAKNQLGAQTRALADFVASSKNKILRRFKTTLDQKITAQRIRTHGDYHLGQVLYTGRDFVIIDFEGEPTRSLSDRRAKRCPLRDVAGMLRSFHYAAETVMSSRVEKALPSPEEAQQLENWALAWKEWVSATFLKAYLERGAGAKYLGRGGDEEVERLLELYLLEKSLYELNYELNNRPSWVHVPLAGIVQTLNAMAET